VSRNPVFAIIKTEVCKSYCLDDKLNRRVGLHCRCTKKLSGFFDKIVRAFAPWNGSGAVRSRHFMTAFHLKLFERKYSAARQTLQDQQLRLIYLKNCDKQKSSISNRTLPQVHIDHFCPSQLCNRRVMPWTLPPFHITCKRPLTKYLL